MFCNFSRKVSPGLMPPGSPGLFRRKSASSDLPPLGISSPSSGAGKSHRGGGGGGGDVFYSSLSSSSSLSHSSAHSAALAQQTKPNTQYPPPPQKQPTGGIRARQKIQQLQQELNKTANNGDKLLKMADLGDTAPATSWSNNKEDYELREVIGMSLIFYMICKVWSLVV